MVILATLLSTPMLTVQNALAADPSPGTAKKYGSTGKIDAIMASGASMIISDSVYKVSPAVRIVTRTGAPAYTTSLKKGMEINFNVDYRQDPKSPVITEIRLP